MTSLSACGEPLELQRHRSAELGVGRVVQDGAVALDHDRGWFGSSPSVSSKASAPVSFSTSVH